jgi:WD40 repeat protein
VPPKRAPRKTVTDTPVSSVVERVLPIAADAPVVGAHFVGRTAAFVLGEEALLFASADGDMRRIAVHGGAILSAAAGADRIVTGGDDGKVAITDAVGKSHIAASDPKHRWIDHVASAPDGAIAWSAGKTAFVRTAKGDQRTLDVASTVGGLAFAPKGFRLALTYYNGVTLWFPNAAQAAPEQLEWKGSHLAVSFSPDGRFLVTAMQEPALHGWRLADRKHMRMSGYPARVHSMDWTASGNWLATSGAEPLILWPFQAKDGPMGKQPRTVSPLPTRVSVVACHPRQEVAAVGYGDGTLLLVRIDDGAEILARRPGGAPVSALAWHRSGTLLAFGTEEGEAGLIDLA